MQDEAVALTAILVKVQTMTDGGWRITFDVPESDTRQVMIISELRHQALKLGIVPDMIAEDHFPGLEDMNV